MKGFIYDIHNKKYEIEWNETERTDPSGDLYIICPICNHTRLKHKNQKILAVNIKKDYYPWKCNHCGESGAVLTKEKSESNNTLVPITKDFKLQLVSDGIKRYFKEKRGISAHVLAYFRVMTLQHNIRQIRVAPGEEQYKDQMRNMFCIFFPSYDGEKLIDVQFRDKNKNFASESGVTKIFFNINDIKGAKKCIITEGRIDCMSFYEANAGIPACSVPNGSAMSPNELEYFRKTGTIDTRIQLQLSYLDIHYSVFEKVEEVIIATDDDPPGIKLREELARRIGKQKCRYIKWSEWSNKKGEPCKDANEVLTDCGPDELKSSVNRAHSFPILGLVRVKDVRDELLYELKHGKEKGLSLGMKALDPHFTLMPGHVIGINGYRNMGKTAFAIQICLSMAIMHNWRIAVYTPENYPPKRLVDKIVQMLLGKPTDKEYENHATHVEINSAIDFIHEYFYIIDEEGKERYNHSGLRKKTEELIVQYGIKMMLKDPWNYIIEERRKGEQIFDYLLRELSNETHFAKYHNIATVINAHPKTPTVPASMEIRRPTDFELYGGGVWSAKLDDIVTVHRESLSAGNTSTLLYVDKTKDHDIIGMPCPNDPIKLTFQRKSQRFYDGEQPDFENHVLNNWKGGTQQMIQGF